MKGILWLTEIQVDVIMVLAIGKQEECIMEIISLKKNESGTFSTRDKAAYEIAYRPSKGEQISTITIAEDSADGKALHEATLKMNRREITREELLAVVKKAVEENSSAVVGIVLKELAEGSNGEAISARIRLIDNSYLEVSGHRINGALSEHLMALIRQRRKDPEKVNNDDWRSLISFTELLFDNVNPEIRDQLYNWMQYQIRNGKLTLTPEGKFLGYKGIRSDFGSCHAGPGIVNGIPDNGHLDNSPGNVIEMAREAVDADRTSYCSTGLHVGSYDYAKSFGQIVVTVEVDPRDVVSVPDDYDGQKLRACKYRVVEQVEDELASFSVNFDTLDINDVLEGKENEGEAFKTPAHDGIYTSNFFADSLSRGILIDSIVYLSSGTEKTYLNFKISSVDSDKVTGKHDDGWASFKFVNIVSTSIDPAHEDNADESTEAKTKLSVGDKFDEITYKGKIYKDIEVVSTTADSATVTTNRGYRTFLFDDIEAISDCNKDAEFDALGFLLNSCSEGDILSTLEYVSSGGGITVCSNFSIHKIDSGSVLGKHDDGWARLTYDRIERIVK